LDSDLIDSYIIIHIYDNIFKNRMSYYN